MPIPQYIAFLLLLGNKQESNKVSILSWHVKVLGIATLPSNCGIHPFGNNIFQVIILMTALMIVVKISYHQKRVVRIKFVL